MEIDEMRKRLIETINDADSDLLNHLFHISENYNNNEMDTLEEPKMTYD